MSYPNRSQQGGRGGQRPERKDNSGALFKNKKKQEEKQPDYTGQAIIAGREYWLSAWIKRSKETKETYMSVAVEPKQQRREENARANDRHDDRGGRQAIGNGNGNWRDEVGSDDIPF